MHQAAVGEVRENPPPGGRYVVFYARRVALMEAPGWGLESLLAVLNVLEELVDLVLETLFSRGAMLDSGSTKQEAGGERTWTTKCGNLKCSSCDGSHSLIDSTQSNQKTCQRTPADRGFRDDRLTLRVECAYDKPEEFLEDSHF